MKKLGLIYILLLFLFPGCAWFTGEKKVEEETTTTEVSQEELSEEDKTELEARNKVLLEKVKNGEIPYVIKFTASFCPPCKSMEPIDQEIANTYRDKMAFMKLNMEEEKGKNLAVKFGVSSVPTYVFVKNNKEVARKVGAWSKEDFEDSVTKNLLS